MHRLSLMNRFVYQSFLAGIFVSVSVALAGTESYDYKEAPPRRRSLGAKRPRRSKSASALLG